MDLKELLLEIVKWIESNQIVIGLVINFIMMLATTAAVFVALFSNKNANKQLKATLRTQEQSKNVELYDRRITICEKVKCEKNVKEIEVKAIFSDNIFNLYQHLIFLSQKIKEKELEKKLYLNSFYKPDGVGGFINVVKDEIYKVEQKISLDPSSDELRQEFKRICDKNEVVLPESPEEGEQKRYNYYEISYEIEKYNNAYVRAKENLLKEMNDFIVQSLS